MTKEYHHIDDFNVGEELIKIFIEEEILSESVGNGLLATVDILEESRDPGFYTFGEGSKVSFETFYAVYTNFDDFPTHRAALEAMGVNSQYYAKDPRPGETKTAEQRAADINTGARKALANAVRQFNKAGFTQMVSPGDRQQYSKRKIEQDSRDMYRREMEDEYGNPFGMQPTHDDILPGSKGSKNQGQSGRIIDQINNAEIIRGELYNNFTRIPKSRWGGWFQFFRKEIASVSSGNKIWKKRFILGYQIEPNVVYEIWYNTINSTFSVHDVRGNEISQRYQILNEALKQMLNAVAKFSRDDAAFFYNANNQLSRSFLNSIRSTADDRVKDLASLEAKEIEKREKAEDSYVKDREKRRQSLIGKAKRRLNIAMKKEAKKASDAAVAGAGAFGAALAREGKELLTGERRRAEAAMRSAQGVGETRTTGKWSNAAEEDRELARRRSERQQRATGRIQTELELDLRGQADRQRQGLQSDPNRATDSDIQTQLRYNRELNQAERELEKLKRELRASEKANKGMFSDEYKPEKNVRTNTSSGVREAALEAGMKRAQSRRDALEKRLKEQEEKRQKAQKKLFNDHEEFGIDGEETFEEFLEVILTEEEEFEFDAMEDAIDDEVDSGAYDSIVKNYRKMTAATNLSGAFIKGTIAEDMVSLYTESRVDKRFGQSGLRRFLLNRNRKPIVLPRDKPTIWNRVKGFFRGNRYRADFISGYTYDDKINVEIWYITEPNPDKDWKRDDRKPATISTFYVFDVTAGVLIRKYIPYYRNAIQVAVTKLSAY